MEAKRINLVDLRERWLARQTFETAIDLRLADFGIRIRSNSSAVVDHLSHYYAPFVTKGTGTGEADVIEEVVVVNAAPPDPGVPLRDVPLEPGKTDRKEAWADLEDGRVVRKVRTGMHFLLGNDFAVAVGPAIANLNQVVNFVDSRYLRWRLSRGGVLLHAAGVAGRGGGAVIAGLSNRGKSTLALRAVASGLSFVSNDRVVVESHGAGLTMLGVAKQPRVNPGTIVNNPVLHDLIPEERREALRRLPPENLWRLEEKYDVDVETVFGPGRRVLSAGLRCVFILSWKRDGGSPMLHRVSLADRPELLGALMKSPGVMIGGPADPAERRPVPERYLSMLKDVPAYEMAGGADFAWGGDTIVSLLARDGGWMRGEVVVG